MNENQANTAGRILTQEEALLRAAEEQAGVVLDVYRDEHWRQSAGLDSSFVEARISSLSDLREALQSELAAEQLLPKEQDPEVSRWHFLVDRVRGLLENEPLAVPLEEEKRLLHLCNELLRTNGSDDSKIRQYRDELVRATKQLRSAD